jgi:hypothetical protein
MLPVDSSYLVPYNLIQSKRSLTWVGVWLGPMHLLLLAGIKGGQVCLLRVFALSTLLGNSFCSGWACIYPAIERSVVSVVSW